MSREPDGARQDQIKINTNMLGRWVQESATDEEQVFRGNGKLTPAQAEIRQLKAQVKRLQPEKEILKIATVFFTAETQ